MTHFFGIVNNFYLLGGGFLTGGKQEKGRINKQNEKCLSDFTSEKRLFQKKIC